MAIATLAVAQAESKQIEFGENSILIYIHETEPGDTQFVLRIARFLPDIVLEWESLSHQGTIHLRKKAVEKGKGLTLSGLFDPGVDSVPPYLLQILCYIYVSHLPSENILPDVLRCAVKREMNGKASRLAQQRQ